MPEVKWLRTAHGDVSLDGGHVTRWAGAGGDILFMSSKSRFEPGHPIRGGIPVIFPWFGDDPESRGRSAHGFARRRPWTLLDRVEEPHVTRCTLVLNDDESTRALWPHRFQLGLTVEFGDALVLTLTTENRDQREFKYEDALHTYFTVGDIHRVLVHGLGAPIAFRGETDHTYGNTTATCLIEDPVRGRTIEVAKEGSRSTIVWNPWIEKAARLSDLGDDEWTKFVCVESGNVGADALTLRPGEMHATLLRISVNP